MFETVRIINEMTSIITDGRAEYVAKKIFPEDIPVYKHLARVSQNTQNIVRIHGVFTVNGCLCAVRDYVEGITLEQYRKINAPLPDAEVRRIASEVCGGLALVHTAGIVHRDINPANIIIDTYGRAVIIDFGISRSVKPGKTADTMILGTQGYAAPEQFGFRQTDARADVYAIGVLINWLLTGKLPNEQLAIGSLGKVVRKCTKPDPADRYRSAKEVLYALKHPLAGFSILCYIPGFRTGNTAHEIIAILYYLFVAFVAMLFSYGEELKMTPLHFLFIVSNFIVPVLIITDFLDWSKRFKFTQGLSKGKLIAVRIALSLLSALPIWICLFLNQLGK
ncbi:MAG: serine/threonine protein kinase [Clostridia bacterium]|nr:serine/threonine protein kinase [Clostridia bacterium]